MRLNLSNIDGLNTFMQTPHNGKHNCAVDLLCCLKNFLLYTIRSEWIEKNPFQRYKVKPEHNKDKDHLLAPALPQQEQRVAQAGVQDVIFINQKT